METTEAKLALVVWWKHTRILWKQVETSGNMVETEWKQLTLIIIFFGNKVETDIKSVFF